MEPTESNSIRPGDKERELMLLRKFIQSSSCNICLLYGLPGVGKTFLLKLFEQEIEGKGEYVWQQYYGYRVNDDQLTSDIAGAKEVNQKRIVIIDEVDGIPPYRRDLFVKLCEVLMALPTTSKVILTTAKVERMTSEVLALPQAYIDVSHPNAPQRKDFIRSKLVEVDAIDEDFIARLAQISDQYDYSDMACALQQARICPVRRIIRGKFRKITDKTNKAKWIVVPSDENLPGVEYATLDQVGGPQNIDRKDLQPSREEIIQAFKKHGVRQKQIQIFNEFKKSIESRNQLTI